MARKRIYQGHSMPAPKGETWVTSAERTAKTNTLLARLKDALSEKGMDGDLWVDAYVAPGIEKLERRAYEEEGCYLKDTALGFRGVILRLGSVIPLGMGRTEDIDPVLVAEEIADKAMADFGKILEMCGCRYDERA